MTRRRREAMRVAAEERAARRKERRGCFKHGAQPKTAPQRESAQPSWSPVSFKWQRGELCEETVAEYLAGPWKKFKGCCPRALSPLTLIRIDYLNKQQREKIRVLLRAVVRVAPKIIDDRFMAGFTSLAELAWIRPLQEWKPIGRSRDTIFKSLVSHLLVKYPVPELLYYAFVGERHSHFSFWYARRFFIAAGRGESLYRLFQRISFPVRMTRQMCHLFMHMPSGTGFIEAVRRAQVYVSGGDIGIARAVCGSVLGREFQGRLEPFWETVILWLCRQSEIDRRQIGPLFDFLESRRAADPCYSIKGRTVKSILRAMEEWHRELATQKKLARLVFKPSGFKGKKYLFKKLNGTAAYHQEWTMQEILHARDLIEEGRYMRHCVSSYAPDIEESLSSIWSLRRDGARALTVEVVNADREVVQARGKCNRNPKALELGILRRWAIDNRLQLRIWHL